MLWTPLKGRFLIEQNTGSVGTTTPGTSVTTGAASGTKGSISQIFASTSFDAYWMTIVVSEYALAATDSQGCLDILIGAATEEVLIPNLLFGSAGTIGTVTAKGPRIWNFPLYVPAGSRISAQAAGQRTSTALRVWMYLTGGMGSPPFRVGSKVVTYGISGVPNGTTIVPGASGVEGSWTQITASTTENHFAIFPSFQVGADTVWVQGALTIDIGVGAATEESIAEGYWFCKDTGEATSGPFPSMPCFQEIPSGTRLVMRASNSGANDASYNGALHCVS